MDTADRGTAAALVQKQIEQIEHDQREPGSMVLVDSFIGDEGASVVADALRNNYTVKSLDMRGCNVRADGAAALAELVENNIHLTSLGLEWNSIGMVESGMQRICHALTRNSTLTELDLRNNGISSTGGAALGEMLAKNTSLKRIDLRWNNLGINGGKALLDGLQRNGSMIELMLAGNKVSDETLRAVDHCLHKNRGHVVEYISESLMLEERSTIHQQNSTSPDTGRSLISSPVRKMSPPSNGSRLHVDVQSPGRRSAGHPNHDSDVSTLFAQTSRLRNTVSGEVLEQNFREKLADLSRALVSEKEANISLERRYCEEVEYRASLESKLLEYERLLRNAEESILHEKSRAEMREGELTSELEKEKGYRHVSDQQLVATKVELSGLTKDHQEHVRETSRKIQELNSEVSRSSHECTVLKKELEEHKNAADRRQQRLLEDLRQTEDQRAHLDKLYHTSTEKVAEVESELAHVRQDLSHQVKVLKEKLEKETADKNHQQDVHVRETRALNDRIRSISDSLQEEQEVCTKTKEDLHSMTTERDRLQVRLNHLMDEATEMRKEMSAKRVEYEGKLEQEIDSRERTESQLADKTAQLSQLKHQFDRYKENMEARVTSLEKQLVSKDQEIAKFKEDEARRIVTLEDRLMHTMRAEIARASPNKHGAGV